MSKEFRGAVLKYLRGHHPLCKMREYSLREKRYCSCGYTKLVKLLGIQK